MYKKYYLLKRKKSDFLKIFVDENSADTGKRWQGAETGN